MNIPAMTYLRFLILGTALLGGCFFYSSSWGQKERSQRHFAKEQTAASLEQVPAGWGRHSRIRARVYVDGSYRRGQGDVAQAVAEVFEYSNAVLVPTLQAMIEVVDTRDLELVNADQSLAQSLEVLIGRDAGEDVDVVIAFVGATPLAASSFHNLGMANVLGKHIALRDLHDVDEYKVFVEGLDELDEAERLRLFRGRRKHKQSAVLLHELGHILGGLHTKATQTLMQPGYDYRADHFAEANLALMRVGLHGLLQSPDTRNLKATAERLATLLRETSYSGWVVDERIAYQAELDQRAAEPKGPQVAKFGQPVGASTTGTTTTAARNRVKNPTVADLTVEDAAVYEEASGAFQKQDIARAWTLASALADRTTASYATQHLACKVAMQGGQPATIVRGYCARMMSLVPVTVAPAAK